MANICVRALSGIQRLVFQNVGLYGRGKLRFRMYTGYDISDAIAPPVLANSTKSNVFVIGYEHGHRTNIGVSFKGKVWSMSSSAIPSWLQWCERVAAKILNPQLPTDRFLGRHVGAKEITEPPDTTIFVVLPPDEWLEADAISMRIQIGMLVDVVSCLSIVGWDRVDQRSVRFGIELQNGGSATFLMTWLEQRLAVEQVEGAEAELLAEDGVMLLSAHFEENFPVLLLSDGSEVRGRHLLLRHQTATLTFAVDQITAVD